MKTVLLSILAWSVTCFATSLAAEPKDPAKIIEDGIQQFYRDVVSDDEQVSKKAVQNFLIDEAGLQALHGKEKGSQMWSIMAKLFENPEVLQKMKQEITQKGAIKKIELIDVRKDDASGRYKQILAVIPADIPVYRAIITTDKGAAGSSSYVIINNQVRFVRGLDSKLETLK